MESLTLGQIWYYMIFLSDNEFLEFWGLIDMYINSKMLILVYFGIIIPTMAIVMLTFRGIYKKTTGISFIVGIIVSIMKIIH